jgi:hypothetical protein
VFLQTVYKEGKDFVVLSNADPLLLREYSLSMTGEVQTTKLFGRVGRR